MLWQYLAAPLLAVRNEIIGFKQAGVLPGEHSPGGGKGVGGHPARKTCDLQAPGIRVVAGAPRLMSVCSGHWKDVHLRVSQALGMVLPFLGLMLHN